MRNRTVKRHSLALWPNTETHLLRRKEEDFSGGNFARPMLYKGPLNAVCKPGSGPGARAAEAMGHGPNLHDPW